MKKIFQKLLILAFVILHFFLIFRALCKGMKRKCTIAIYVKRVIPPKKVANITLEHFMKVSENINAILVRNSMANQII